MSRFFLCLGMGLILFGAGCSFPHLPSSTTPTSSIATSTNLLLVPGDRLEIRQTFLGIGAGLPDLTKTKDGVRLVTLSSFEPRQQAALAWTMSLAQETSSSRAARAAYDADLRAHPRPIGEKTPDPPEIVMEKVVTSGTVDRLDLFHAHTLFLPAYWDGLQHTLDKSGLWLSDDVFQELTRTRVATLDFGVERSPISTALTLASDWKKLMNRLHQQADQDQQDPTLVKADPDFIDWTVRVNGSERQVSAFRAKNWYGDLVVLNNRDNPLILKFTANPLASGDLLGGMDALKKSLGYEITDIYMQR